MSALGATSRLDADRVALRGGRVSAVVVKVGGSLFESGRLSAVLAGVAGLHRAGLRAVLVHGGGPLIARAVEKAGLRPLFRDGLRVTDGETLEIVEATLTGRANPRIVGILNARGVPAVGISGRDGGLLRAAPHPDADRLGRVGRVAEVTPEPVEALWAAGFLPVVSPVSGDARGRRWNVNADEAAGAIAAALGADRLVTATDVEGVRGPDGRRLPVVTAGQIRELIASGHAAGGMVPKLRACLAAVRGGAGGAWIGPGADPSAPGLLLDAALGRTPLGTRVLLRERTGGEPGRADVPAESVAGPGGHGSERPAGHGGGAKRPRGRTERSSRIQARRRGRA